MPPTMRGYGRLRRTCIALCPQVVHHALALRVDGRDVGGPGQPGAAMPVRVAPLAERVAAIAVR